jgi:uncharacterized membrane protein YidH (DUF202 family)
MKHSLSQNDVTTDAARAQLILAEKRTSLSVVRTAIAIIALPLSIVTALIALSRYYDVVHNLPLLIPLLLICLGLTVVGIYLFVRSLRKIHHYDHLLRRLKERDPEISELLD